MVESILEIENVSVEYRALRGQVKAVRNVSVSLMPHESLALIGESGSGKTTLGLAIVRLLPKTADITTGDIYYRRNGQIQNVLEYTDGEMRAFRWKDCAMVFQSALNSLNPVLRIEDQVLDTAKAHGETKKPRVLRQASGLLQMVQLDPDRVLHSYPHELSGGMRQRVLLALGVLLNPPVVILDEPTTALDILTQRTIIEGLKELQRNQGFSVIFISHDLSIAAELADRVATMYAGAVVEIGPVNDIFYRPQHPYTLGLIRAVPTVTGSRRELVSIPGSPPDLIDLPSGCKFHPRCPYATIECEEAEPPLVEVAKEHEAACFHTDQVIADRDAAGYKAAERWGE